MKYKTFRALVVGGGVLLVGGAVVAGARLVDWDRQPVPAPITAAPAANHDAPVQVATEEVASVAPVQVATAEVAEVASAVPESDSSDGLRPLDKKVLDRVREGISGTKVKDAFRGESWKVNLYRDQGYDSVNRLKLDLDRDEKWDEKWTFVSGPAGTVKRQVSPADDESYTVEYRLENGRWIRR